MSMIALVFWLTTVFLSVMGGLEERWVHDFSRVIPHIKLVPSQKYFGSYYYRIDEHASDSGFSSKTLGEKFASPRTDPYDRLNDDPLPDNFPYPEISDDGSLRDYVKETWNGLALLSEKHGWFVKEYEEGVGCLKFDLPEEDGVRRIEQFSRILNARGSKMSSLLMQGARLNKNSDGEEIVILPEHFRSEGVSEGVFGFLNFYSMGDEGLEEQSLAVRVSGFYKPGISPIGAKTVFASSSVLDCMRHTESLPYSMNCLEIVLTDLKQIDKSRSLITSFLETTGLSDYWTVESFYDSPQFKPIFDQLRSDRTIFLIVAVILLLVACSNVIGMLVLLVNDKKKEIGILRALGASPGSLSCIFGICGAVIGLFGSLFGGILAFVTVRNLDSIITIFNVLQGRQSFNKAIFGDFTPDRIDFKVLIVLGITTVIMAGISGVFPARKVSRMNISEILKSD